MTTTYQPAMEGGWIGLIHSGVTLVLDPGDGGDDLVRELWAVAQGSDPLQPLLDRLTRHGLSATPHFALVEWSGAAQARVIVRGGVRATVTDGAGDHLLAGTGVSTWAERTFTGVDTAHLVVEGSTPAAVTLPLVSGMALAATISVSRSEWELPAPQPEPATPQPEPATPQPEPATPLVEPAETPQPEPATPQLEPATPLVEPAETPPPVDDSLSEETVVAPARTRTAVLPVASGDPAAESGGPSEQTVVSLGDLTAAEVAPEPAVGDTVFRSVGEDTALPDQADPRIHPGDHDGQTVMTSDIRALRESRGAPSPERESPSRKTDEPERKPALQSVRLVLPDGDIQQLDRPVLIGRSPSVTQVSGGSMPRLVVLGTGDQDISRNHAQVALEGGTVVVTDLHSRNGTLVELPGKPPQKLRAGEPTSVIVGTVIDLGGGITIRVDEA